MGADAPTRTFTHHPSPTLWSSGDATKVRGDGFATVERLETVANPHDTSAVRGDSANFVARIRSGRFGGAPGDKSPWRVRCRWLFDCVQPQGARWTWSPWSASPIWGKEPTSGRPTSISRLRRSTAGALSMAGDRLLRILGMLAAGGVESGTARLCEVSAAALQVTGAGIMLMSGDLRAGSVCSSNGVSALIEELQYTLGEGPCVDAYREDRPVLEPDLADPEVPRWIAFTPPAVAAGARAVFGFPMQVGAARLGALNVYRDEPGPLSDDQHADALVMADVAAMDVLVMQANAPPGALATELEAGANFRFVVHQASGMVSVQLGVSVTEALIRLRAYAFTHDRMLNDVADDIVARRLRLT